MRQGWEIKKLGEVAMVSAGNSAPQKKELFENGIYPFIRTSDVGQIRKGFISSCVDYLNKDGIKGLKLYKKGTILFPKSGASTFLNHRVMMEVDGYVSSHLATIKANASIADDRFLLYFLTTIDARDLMQDIAYPSLKTSDIGLIEIPLPPLSEQQRIVAILDEAFAAIAKAKANAEQNLKNAKELFNSYFLEIFENKGKDWEDVRFEDLCKLTRGHNPPKSKFISEPKEGYVRFYQIRDGWADNYTVYVPITPQLHMVEPDEILMVAYRHIGKVFRGVSGAFNVALCKISNKDRKVLDDDFLFYIIPTDFVKGELLKRSERSLIPSMSVEHLKEILIPLPPLKTQRAIVQKLDALLAETKKLEAIYQTKINNLEELKKSVLQKAFNGELITSTELV